MADPTSLLDSPEFHSTGALLWPDYWHSTAAPDLRAILEVPTLPASTFESGQMVFDKQRCVLTYDLASHGANHAAVHVHGKDSGKCDI